jgi:hypothetical protein
MNTDLDGLRIEIRVQPTLIGIRQPAWGWLVCDCGETVMTWIRSYPPRLSTLNMAAYAHRNLLECPLTEG